MIHTKQQIKSNLKSFLYRVKKQKELSKVENRMKKLWAKKEQIFDRHKEEFMANFLNLDNNNQELNRRRLDFSTNFNFLLRYSFHKNLKKCFEVAPLIDSNGFEVTGSQLIVTPQYGLKIYRRHYSYDFFSVSYVSDFKQLGSLSESAMIISNSHYHLNFNKLLQSKNLDYSKVLKLFKWSKRFLIILARLKRLLGSKVSDQLSERYQKLQSSYLNTSGYQGILRSKKTLLKVILFRESVIEEQENCFKKIDEIMQEMVEENAPFRLLEQIKK